MSGLVRQRPGKVMCGLNKGERRVKREWIGVDGFQPKLLVCPCWVRSAMLMRAWRKMLLPDSSSSRHSATQAVVNWSSWNFGFGWRLAGER